MTGALLLTAAAMGLAATPHCASMCGAACAWCGKRPGGVGQTALLAGRLVGYAAAGALIAGLFQAAGWMSGVVSGFRPLWGIAQLLLLVLGAMLVLRGSFPLALLARIDDLRGRCAAPKGPLDAPGPDDAESRSVPSPAIRRFMLGLMWPVVPCGVLHAALLLAALASSAQEGAGVMLSFGIASTPGLIFGARLWSWIGDGIGRATGRRSAGSVSAQAASVQAAPLIFYGSAGAGAAATGGQLGAGPMASAFARMRTAQTAPMAETLPLRLAGAALVASSSWWLWQHYFSPVVSAWCA